MAIPTFVGYKFLSTRINRMTLEMEESATELTELFVRSMEQDPPAAFAPTHPHPAEVSATAAP